MQIEVHILNGDMYNDLCDSLDAGGVGSFGVGGAAAPAAAQLRACVLAAPAGRKPLLRREGAPARGAASGGVLLPLEVRRRGAVRATAWSGWLCFCGGGV